MEVLEREEWRARAASHAARLDAYLVPHLARREAGVKHPVHDFLFTYYSYRPAQLRLWHPGYGVALAGAPEYQGIKGYADGAVTAHHLESQLRLVRGLRNLMVATASRPAHLGCFGLHEWAMVYQQSPEQLRHNGWPLRLGSTGTDTVVERHRVVCSHFDAFRFFTEPARPLNLLSPGRDDREAFEQPGCLHVGMDLYKHAFRLSPLISSDLVVDCFELAWEIRTMDMRAAPYDLSGTTLDPSGEAWSPIEIETPGGKAEYVALQREYSERAAALRDALITACERLL
ncbi:3-methyladenine DNA glycosylase [Nocardioides sp. BGMRC 2183]|nr:3-methyladenine DNA glycosylase [Nocardioides sp. BGMRC 2183]